VNNKASKLYPKAVSVLSAGWCLLRAFLEAVDILRKNHPVLGRTRPDVHIYLGLVGDVECATRDDRDARKLLESHHYSCSESGSGLQDSKFGPITAEVRYIIEATMVHLRGRYDYEFGSATFDRPSTGSQGA